MEIQVVSKLDVVTRVLRAAIRLFFEQRDMIAIHTLIAAAHQILFDLGKRSGVSSVVKNTAALKDEEVQRFLKDINYPYNFFKHADRDPDKSIDVGPLERLTADFILDAIIMLQRLEGDLPLEAQVYWHWFVSYYHEEFDNLPKDGAMARMQELELGRMTFPEILALFQFAEIVPDSGA